MRQDAPWGASQQNFKPATGLHVSRPESLDALGARDINIGGDPEWNALEPVAAAEVFPMVVEDSELGSGASAPPISPAKPRRRRQLPAAEVFREGAGSTPSQD